MPDSRTQAERAARADAASSVSETRVGRPAMKAVGVYERPKRRPAIFALPRPLALALLILAVISFIILLKNLF